MWLPLLKRRPQLVRQSGFRMSYVRWLKAPAIRAGLFYVAVLVAIGVIGRSLLIGQAWGLLSAEIVLVALLAFYWGLESGEVSAKFIAIVAVLGAVAGLGRIPLAGIPNVQPTTFIVIVSGFVLGPRTGFLVGSTAALTSNFFLGQGPWTPWQMVAWGLGGVVGGMIGGVLPRLGKGLLVVNFAWGYIFGWIMDLWVWTAFVSPLDWRSFVSTCVASVWFDTFHAVGNIIFFLVFGSSLIKILRRFRRKLSVTLISDSEVSV